MKENVKKDIRRNLAILFGGVLAVLLGWVLSGWNNLGDYLDRHTEKAVVWGLIGLFVGNVVNTVLYKIEGKDGKPGEDK